MASKIKVDNINKVSDDSNIIKKCGTTITLGASGDSIALATGASQTGLVEQVQLIGKHLQLKLQLSQLRMAKDIFVIQQAVVLKLIYQQVVLVQ